MSKKNDSFASNVVVMLLVIAMAFGGGLIMGRGQAALDAKETTSAFP